jgi:peptidoglycan/LPS O-acetylase OafA/YrhL
LRAIAVLLVLLVHAQQTQGFPDIRTLQAFGSRASIGVDVFFVISGFLITVLMIRERDHTGRLEVQGFYPRLRSNKRKAVC